MLDRIFKIMGIAAFIAIIIAGLSIMYDVFIRSGNHLPPEEMVEHERPLMPRQKALLQTHGEVIKHIKEDDKLALMVRIKNPSNFTINTLSLTINILSTNGELIDQCLGSSQPPYAPNEIQPKETAIQKIVCHNMLFMKNSNEELKFEVKFSPRNYF